MQNKTLANYFEGLTVNVPNDLKSFTPLVISHIEYLCDDGYYSFRVHFTNTASKIFSNQELLNLEILNQNSSVNGIENKFISFIDWVIKNENELSQDFVQWAYNTPYNYATKSLSKVDFDFFRYLDRASLFREFETLLKRQAEGKLTFSEWVDYNKEKLSQKFMHWFTCEIDSELPKINISDLSFNKFINNNGTKHYNEFVYVKHGIDLTEK